MTKRPIDYPDRIEAWCPEGTRDQLEAIAYHMGARGEASTPVRNFVVNGIHEYIDSLQGRKLKDFQEILQNVKVRRIGLKQKSPA